ncbi:YqcI/YcgG family protein [Bacillus sp. JJ1122]|uniref:YqcI/YcgG family protein n=1 Tax=Bacillus sp. JJ1122 TaxID=3122951 RepID=UPI003F68AE9C
MRIIRILHRNIDSMECGKRKILRIFNEKIQNKNRPFPCIPATTGHSLNQFCYGFAGDPTKQSTSEELANLLREFTEVSRSLGKFTSLVIFFDTPADLIESYKVEDYEQLFWELLNGLGKMDVADWPAHIPSDPENSAWEFCFHGEQYFMYCATPAHEKRKSRHFPCFMLAITPRWVLTEFNSSAAGAAKIKANIRKRLELYDTSPIHPDLNSYGNDDNFEWKQYFLHDEQTSLSECPFHKYLKNQK